MAGTFPIAMIQPWGGALRSSFNVQHAKGMKMTI